MTHLEFAYDFILVSVNMEVIGSRLGSLRQCVDLNGQGKGNFSGTNFMIFMVFVVFGASVVSYGFVKVYLKKN